MVTMEKNGTGTKWRPPLDGRPPKVGIIGIWSMQPRLKNTVCVAEVRASESVCENVLVFVLELFKHGLRTLFC